jgi:hypothetical protein
MSESNHPGANGEAEITVRGTAVELVRVPEVPVMATVAIPGVAALLAVRVRMVDTVAGFELNEAVTPLGRPETDKFTAPENPFCGVMVIVVEPFPVCGKAKLTGEAESVNCGPGLTVTEIVVVFVNPPTEPETVSPKVPVAALLAAVRVMVLEAEAGFGLKDAVTPLGRPETDKLTLLTKPFCGVTLIVLVPVVP